ncbi:hypothetical protein F2P81_002779 [Scophthalmus maximus]|uniref:Uncharacterized protein n=1 Tax=Scophthalmus maximus TaxID=52904 RepID=A0A6A4TRL3_SCOMX|nr:hypothetical protein F2P81_002779 [Scophthalmus maximus]
METICAAEAAFARHQQAGEDIMCHECEVLQRIPSSERTASIDASLANMQCHILGLLRRAYHNIGLRVQALPEDPHIRPLLKIKPWCQCEISCQGRTAQPGNWRGFDVRPYSNFVAHCDVNAVASRCEQSPPGASDQRCANQKRLEPATRWPASGGKVSATRRADG